MTFKTRISQFMTEMNPNNGNKSKSDIFSWDIFKSDIVFHWLQNTKLSLQCFSISLKKLAQTVFFLIYKVVHYLNDF